MTSRNSNNTTQKLLTILLVLLLIIAGFSAYRVISITLEYRREEQTHQRLVDEVVNKKDKIIEQDKQNPDDVVEESPYLSIDHARLREINGDYQGWINIPDTNISYPVVQTNDNSYYVHVNFEDNYSGDGTIFVDYRNEPGFAGFNSIMYGHLRKNKTMFWWVSQFRHTDYYNAHNRVEIYTDDTLSVYTPFAFFKTTSTSQVYTTYFPTDQSKSDYIRYLTSNSYYSSPIDVKINDHIIILSTCTDASSNNRWVLCCVLTEVIDLTKEGH